MLILSTHLVVFDIAVYSCKRAIILNHTLQCHLEEDGPPVDFLHVVLGSFPHHCHLYLQFKVLYK